MTAASGVFTWYRPEFPADSTAHTCYCHKPAYGRTTFWDGQQRNRAVAS